VAFVDAKGRPVDLDHVDSIAYRRVESTVVV